GVVCGLGFFFGGGGVVSVVVVVVVVVVVGVVWGCAVVETGAQSFETSVSSLLAACVRLLRTVPLTEPGRFSTRAFSATASDCAALQSCWLRALLIWSRLPLSDDACCPESSPDELPQAASERTSGAISPAKRARGGERIRALTLEAPVVGVALARNAAQGRSRRPCRYWP